jgi:hypothetical protein
VVANALSRCHKDGLHVHAISGSIFEAYDTLREELTTHPQAMQIRNQLREGTVPPGLRLMGFLCFRTCVSAR